MVVPRKVHWLMVLGAYFGTTFPHLFFQTFPELLPSPGPQPRYGMRIYIPKIYGFKVIPKRREVNNKISERAKNGSRMQWLRMIPSEEARRTRRGIKKYFEFQGEPIELSDLSDREDQESEDDDEEDDHGDFMEEEGLDIVEIE